MVVIYGCLTIWIFVVAYTCKIWVLSVAIIVIVIFAVFPPVVIIAPARRVE